MSKINLKEQAVKGATVHFRCGGSAVIEKIREINYDPYPPLFHLTFEEHQTQIYCSAKGTTEAPNKFLDIIRIDTPEFDWSTAKPGMAFRCVYEGLVWFGFCDWYRPDSVWMVERKECWQTYSAKKKDLTRAPEHDIEVK